MAWNWTSPDWPRFTWDEQRLNRAEDAFLHRSGQFVGMFGHLREADHEQLLITILSEEAMTTSEIEGELLNRDSVQSSIRRDLGLASDARRVSPGERGIGEVMVDLFRNYSDPLTEETLCDWHGRMMRGRDDLRDIGRYRTHAEPMQVVSGAMGRTKVHFEAPPSERVSREMAEFIRWFHRSGPAGAERLPAVTRAGIAHLYFECIHPFEDGNGRVGRAVIEKALAQSIGQPLLTSMAMTILRRRREYYANLELANKQTEVTDWLAWFAGVTLEAQERTLVQVQFLMDKTRYLDRWTSSANPRQLAALLRMFAEGPEGFKGGLSAGKYVAINKTTSATATRDLAELVESGALTRTGEKRGTRYHLPIPLRPVARVEIDTRGDIVRATGP